MARIYLIDFAILLLSVLVAVPALAQDWQWVELDGSAPGTPPTVTLVAESSNVMQSTFLVQIHGYYIRNVQFLGETFQKLHLPGAGALHQRGRPRLPELRLSLAIPTATDTVGTTTVQVLQTQTVPGVRVFPAQAELWDLVPNDPIPGADPAWDEDFYQQPGPYPVQKARQRPRLRDWQGVTVRSAVVHPFRAVTASNELIIHRELLVTYHHPGTVLPPRQVSRRVFDMVTMTLDNVDELSGWIQMQGTEFNACYLFLTIPEYVDALDALAVHKFSQGYDVTIWDTSVIGGNDCETLRTAVQDWYAESCDPAGDAYVLLVGDSDQLEMCTTGFGGVCEGGDCTEEHFSDFRIGVLSDDLDDIYQDAGVGRLSVDDEMDLVVQLEKVMRYESTPPNAADFWGEVLLAAHHDAGFHYIESAETAADWPDYEYWVQFTERYGDQADGTVAQVIADINDGMSVVAYRGIGSNTAWDAWDYTSQSLTSADVAALANGAKNPVVFAIAGGNSGIDKVDDAMGETWLNGALGGAVFHYGSTRTSGTAHNNELLPAIFRLLYGGANPTLWELTTWAQYEAKDLAGSTESTSEHTIRQYQILGLPDMKVYTETPYELVVNGLPERLVGLGPHTVTLDIDLTSGESASHAKVTYEIERKLLYKSEYSDEDGQLTSSLEYESYGTKYVEVTDDFGSALPWEGFIEVVEPGTDVPQTQAFSASAAPNPFNPSTTIHFRLPQAGHLSIRIYDARGRLVRALVDDDLVAGPGETSWDGTDTSGRDLAAGVYFYEVRTEIERTVGKLALVK